MADSWPTQLAFAALNILLGMLFVAPNTDLCGSVFETQIDHALLGHVMDTVTVVDEFECQLKCIGNKSCKSVNVRTDGNKPQRRICELSNKTRQMKPGDFKYKKGSTYYGSVQASCIDVSREKNKQTKSGECHPGYKGKKCEKPIKGLYANQPAHSCKDIRDSGDSKGDGEYWIDPEKTGNTFKVYCDMTTDGGGWLLVSNIVKTSLSLQLSIETSYRGISSYHNNKTVLTKSAMKELWTHLSFTQIRFHCSKQQGRTFHVTTVANSTGEAVVQYFSGQTDVSPDACGSFVRMDDDNSKTAKVCKDWGVENGVTNAVGKWSSDGVNKKRLYEYIFIVWFSYHWLIWPDGGRLECDDFNGGVSAGDFWKIYVR